MEKERRELGNGQHLSLWVPNTPDENTMRARCPVVTCREYVTERPDPNGIAQIALHNQICDAQPFHPLIASGWGHYSCIFELFERRASGLAMFPPLPSIGEIAVKAIETKWHFGVQRDMVLFIQRYPGREIVVDYMPVPDRPAAARYRWRLAFEESQ